MTARLALLALCALAAGTGQAAAHRTDCPSSNPPDELVVFGGSGQTAQLGKEFPAKLEAQLANKNGCPVTGNLAGIDVDFDAPGSGASGIFTGSGSRRVMVGTDAQGVATAPTFTADDTAGSYTVDAHSDYGTVEFFLTNTASGLAAGITASAGDGQSASVFGEYAQPLQARVVDANDNPVQGATVSFTVVPGSTGAAAGFLTGAQVTAATGSDGLATSPPLIANGNPGRFSAVASTEGIASVATYRLDNHAVAQTLSAVDAGPQSATVGTAYGSPLTARLLDADGLPVEGGPVTFTLGGGAVFLGGSDQATALTDDEGVATSPTFRASDTTGSFVATATVAGSAPVEYALRNLPANVSLSVRSRRGAVGKPYRAPLIATVRDNRNRPIRGAAVVFTVTPGGGASASFPGGKQATVATDTNGRAIAPTLAANRLAGRFTVTATVAGSSRLVHLQNVAGRPATLVAGAASGESTPSSTRFPVPLAVTVTDSYGNRVAGAGVTFVAPSHGPSGAFKTGRTTTVHTNAKGIAVAPPFTADGVVGGYLVRAFVRRTGARASFALVNTPR